MSLRLFLLATALLTPATVLADQYVVGDRPEALVSPPFPCPPGMSYDEEAEVQVHVAADGFVDSSFFIGPTPPDSAIVGSIAHRWIFRPATFWSAGPNPGEPRGAWFTIHYRSRCWDEAMGQSAGLHILKRPDSMLRARVRDAREVTAWRLIPPNAENFAAWRAAPGSIDRAVLSRHWVKGTRIDSTGTVQRALLELLDDPRSRQGSDPIDRRCLPEPDLGIALGKFATSQPTMIFISSECDFMQIITPEAVLLLPYAPLREQMLDLARSLFPDDPAYDPSREFPRR
jgi:hypothetical protein